MVRCAESRLDYHLEIATTSNFEPGSFVDSVTFGLQTSYSPDLDTGVYHWRIRTEWDGMDNYSDWRVGGGGAGCRDQKRTWIRCFLTKRVWGLAEWRRAQRAGTEQAPQTSRNPRPGVPASGSHLLRKPSLVPLTIRSEPSRRPRPAYGSRVTDGDAHGNKTQSNGPGPTQFLGA